MPLPPLLWLLGCGLLASAVLASYSEDQCSWRGSGLSQETNSVEQLSLHCAEGSLEWLYPAGALRLTLSPRLPPGSAGAGQSPRHITACIKSSGPFRGAQVYVERDGLLELLLAEAQGPPRGRCVSWQPQERVALFVQSTPHRDISRRVAAFRYELRGDWHLHLPLFTHNLSMEGTCRPCSDAEVLMAVCTSDFVVRGTICGVTHDQELQESVISISTPRIHRQKFPLFQPAESSNQVSGTIRTPLRCGVRPGPGIFLFTGWSHFGEAWLGCAPRYQDFRRMYEAAQAAHHNPCEMALD
ncbi:meteorin [Monodelphis domestica]|uniref:Meteorin, glial cell differentiation regulator n=1 Tax=Monodelphis domestica TaxID=13616 RepID=A0A5F8GPB6_MONDO|nr:meteorin [Monodelphis domestica]